MGNSVVHFEILGPDGAGLTDFYGRLFGWQMQLGTLPGYPHYGFLPTPDGTGIGGGVGTADAVSKSLVTVYVEVDDPQAAIDRAVELGATVTLPVTTIPDVATFGRFRDPQGNEVGVVQRQAG